MLTPNDLETLAAFVEGRLEGAERDAVVARLAEDEDYYEVYTETLHFLEEEAADASPAPHGSTAVGAPDAASREAPAPMAPSASPRPEPNAKIASTGTSSSRSKESPLATRRTPDEGARSVERMPSRSRRKPSRWKPALLAAAALLPIAAGMTLFLLGSAPASSRNYLGIVADRTAIPEPVIGDVRDWRRVRSGSLPLPPGLGKLALDTRIGVRQIDLAIAMSIGSKKEAQRHAGRLDALLAGGEHSIAVDFRPLVDGLQIDGSTPELERQRQRLADDVDVLLADAPGYQLGLWLQTCRIAAASGDIAFFNRRGTRRAFHELDIPSLLPEDAAKAQTVASLLDNGVTPADLEILGEACYALVVAGGNRSRF